MNIEQKKEYAKSWENQLERFNPILTECFKEYYIGSDYRNNLHDEEIKQKIERIEDVISSITFIFGTNNKGKFEYISSTNEERIKLDEKLINRINNLTCEEEALVFPKTQPPVIVLDISRGFDVEKLIFIINHTLHNKILPQMENVPTIMSKYLPERYQEGISNVDTKGNNLFYEIVNQCMTKDVIEILKNKIPNYPIEEDGIPPIYVVVDDMLNNIFEQYYDVKKEFLKNTLLRAEGNIVVDEIEENTKYRYNELNKILEKLYEQFNRFMIINQNNFELVGKSLQEQETTYKELFYESDAFANISTDEVLLAFEEYVNKLKNNIGSY